MCRLQTGEGWTVKMIYFANTGKVCGVPNFHCLVGSSNHQARLIQRAEFVDKDEDNLVEKMQFMLSSLICQRLELVLRL